MNDGSLEAELAYWKKRAETLEKQVLDLMRERYFWGGYRAGQEDALEHSSSAYTRYRKERGEK